MTKKNYSRSNSSSKSSKRPQSKLSLLHRKLTLREWSSTAKTVATEITRTKEIEDNNHGADKHVSNKLGCKNVILGAVKIHISLSSFFGSDHFA